VSVTLVHHAKDDGRNEMPFDRDSHVVPSNTVLDRAPVPYRMGDFGVGTLSSPIAKLLWPLFLNFSVLYRPWSHCEIVNFSTD